MLHRQCPLIPARLLIFLLYPFLTVFIIFVGSPAIHSSVDASLAHWLSLIPPGYSTLSTLHILSTRPNKQAVCAYLTTERSPSMCNAIYSLRYPAIVAGSHVSDLNPNYLLAICDERLPLMGLSTKVMRVAFNDLLFHYRLPSAHLPTLPSPL